MARKARLVDAIDSTIGEVAKSLFPNAGEKVAKPQKSGKFAGGRPFERDEIEIAQADCWNYLRGIANGSVDLVLTDPPYTISRKTGFSQLGENSVERFAVSMEFGEWDTEQIDLIPLSLELFRTLRKGGTAIVWYEIWKT